MASRLLTLAAVLLLVGFGSRATQATHALASAPATDATWTRQFAVPFNRSRPPPSRASSSPIPIFTAAQGIVPAAPVVWYDHDSLVSRTI